MPCVHIICKNEYPKHGPTVAIVTFLTQADAVYFADDFNNREYWVSEYGVCPEHGAQELFAEVSR